MARIENLTGHDRDRIGQARRVLAEAQQLGKADGPAKDRMAGRVQVALEQLLGVFDEAGV
jgi:hypothetical protein